MHDPLQDPHPALPRRRTLDPKLDVVFKMLFGDERNQALLIAFLNAVLEPPVPITGATVLNRELARESVWEHGAILDVRVRLADGRQVDVEMQCAWHVGFRSRVLYYWAKGYSSQLHLGADYGELLPIISVLVLDFSELQGERFHSEFRLKEVHDGELFSSDIAVHVLELPNLERALAAGDRTPVVDWGRFLAATTDEELEQIAMTRPELRQAKEALERLSVEPAAQQVAREREEARWNYERTLRLTRELGQQEGRAEGEAMGRAEGEAKGRAHALVQLIERKFGAVEEGVRQRILGLTRPISIAGSTASSRQSRRTKSCATEGSSGSSRSHRA